MPNEREYTNGELGLILTNLKDEVLPEMKGHLLEIKEQTIKTNGSVRNLQLWRSYILGGFAVFTLLAPFMWYVINLSINEQRTQIMHEIDKRIGDAINANNDKYFEEINN